MATTVRRFIAQFLSSLLVLGSLSAVPLVALSSPAGATSVTLTNTITVSPPPTSSFTGSSGGDGWILAFSSNQVFTVFHNPATLEISCHLESNAAACPGWGGTSPTGLLKVVDAAAPTTPLYASFTPSLYYNPADGKLYIWATEGTSSSNYTTGVIAVSVGQVTATNVLSSISGTYTPLTGAGGAYYSSRGWFSNAAMVGSRWFVFNAYPSTTFAPSGNATRNTLMCFDFSTLGACTSGANNYNPSNGSSTTDSSNPASYLTTEGNDVLLATGISGSQTLITCVDASAATLATCSGSSWPVKAGVSAGQDHGALLPTLSTAGQPTGACLRMSAGSSSSTTTTTSQWSGGHGSHSGGSSGSSGSSSSSGSSTSTYSCYALTGAAMTAPTGLAALDGAANSDTRSGPAVVLGTRIIFTGTVSSALKVYCYDYATSSSCSGSYAWSTVAPATNPTASLPTTTSYPLNFTAMKNNNYTVIGDPYRPGCVWVNADSGTQIANFDGYNTGPCGNGGQRALVSSFVAPSASCTPSSYGSLNLLAPTSGFTSATATVESSGGSPITSIGTNGVLPFTNGSINLATYSATLASQSALPQFVINLYNGSSLVSPPPSITLSMVWTSSNATACTTGGPTIAQPAATTLAPSNLTSSGAQLNGTIGDVGGSPTTASFCLSTSPTVTNGALGGCLSGNVGVVAGSPTSGIATAAPVSANATGLTAGVTYYYQVIGAGAGTTTYGGVVSFVAGAPTVSTSAASSVTTTTATLNGTVLGTGGSLVTPTFCLSTANTLTSGHLSTCGAGSQGSVSPATVATTASNQAISASATGLTANTTYYYQTVAHNAQNPSAIVYGPVVSFTTTVYTVTYSTTTSKSSVTATGTAPVDSASPYQPGATPTVLGNGNGLLSLTNYDFVGWCTTNNATSPTQCGSGGHIYLAGMTLPALTANVTLYPMWIAQTTTTITSITPSYASSVWTETVNVTVATKDTSSGVVPSGTVSVDDGANYCTVTLTSASSYSATGSCQITSETVPGPYIIEANYGGDTYTEGSGYDVNIAGVTTNPATAVTTTAATLNGAIGLVGGTASAYFILCPAANEGLTSSTQAMTCSGSTAVSAAAAAKSLTANGATYSTAVTGLTTNTQYDYQAIAVENGVYTYGAVQTFKTGLPTVVTNDPISTTSTSAQLDGTVVSGGGLSGNLTSYTFCVSTSSTTNTAGQMTGTCKSLTSGTLTPSTIAGSATNIDVQATVGGLTNGTTYYYQIIATNGNGTAYGNVVSFVAQNNYTVTYVATTAANTTASGSPSVDDQSPYPSGSTPTVLGNLGDPALTLANYTFEGWCLVATNAAPNVCATPYLPGSTLPALSANVTLYSLWLVNTQTSVTGVTVAKSGSNYVATIHVTVTPAAGSATPTGTVTVSDGNLTCTVTLSAGSGTCTITESSSGPYGYVASYGGDTKDNPSMGAASTYGVIYNVGAGSNAPTDQLSYFPTAAVTVNVAPSTTPTLSNYTFYGWCSVQVAPGASCTGTTYHGSTTAATMGNQTLELYAIWNPVTYTVTYHVNGTPNPGSYTGVTTQQVTGLNYGSAYSVVAPTGTFTHAFVAWCSTNTGTSADPATCTGMSYSVGENITILGNTDLYSYWATTASVTYDANGGNGGPSNATGLTLGNSYAVDFTSNPTNAGYIFGGWCTEPVAAGATCAGTTYTSPSSITMTSNVTLYAIWTAVTYPLSFSGGTGASSATVPGTQSYQGGATVTLPSNAQLANYSLSGWCSTNPSSPGSTCGGTSYNPGDPYTMPSMATTLYALWTGLPYTVNYSVNGVSGVSGLTTTSETHPYGYHIPSFQSPTRSGYTFAGWCASVPTSSNTACASSVTAPYSVTGNATLYAYWTPVLLTLTFADSPSNTNPAAANIPSAHTGLTTGTVVTLPDGITLAGYVMAGWCTTNPGPKGSACVGTSYAVGSNYTVNASATLYAYWVSSVTISYNPNGGYGGPSAQTGIAAGTSTPVSLSSAPLLLHNTFAGWCTVQVAPGAACTGTTYATGGTTSLTPSANVTLYALWTPQQVALTYSAGGVTGVTGLPVSANYTIGSNATLAPGGSLTSYYFAGWCTAAPTSAGTVCPGQVLSAGSQLTMNAATTVYAFWDPTFSVTYNAGDGQGAPSDPNSYITGQTVNVLTGPAPSLTGYQFAGWCTVQVADGQTCTGTTYPATGSPSFTVAGASVTLYALWTPEVYTLTYMDGTDGSNTSSGLTPTASYNYNSNATLAGGVTLNTPYAVGQPYVLVGWCDVDPQTAATPCAGNEYTIGSAFTITQDTTLYAVWGIDPNVFYNFEGGAGGPVDNTNYVANDPSLGLVTIQFAPAPTLANYQFVGWCSVDLAAGSLCNATQYNAAPTVQQFIIGVQDVTFYAVWSPVAYTVGYSDDNATGATNLPAGSTYSYGDNIVLPAGPSLPGYVFAGWCNVDPGAAATSCGGTSYAGGANYTVSGDETLYAYWTLQVQITYDANGGSGVPSDPNTYMSGNTASVLFSTTPTDAGYNFTGWCSVQVPAGQSCNATLYTAAGLNSLTVGGSNITLFATWSAVPAPASSTGPTTPSVPQYVITFQPNGGTGTMAPEAAKVGQALDPNVFVRPGYIFVGWNTAPNGTGSPLANLQAYPFSSSVTLYAQWKAVASPAAVTKTTYDLGVVYFGTNLSSVNNAVSMATLKAAARAIINGRYRTLTLTGMTDLRASVAYNKALSARRAAAVKNELLVLLHQMGETLPVTFTTVPAGISTKFAGLAANRRTEISGTPGQ